MFLEVRRLNSPHEPSSDILVHNNVHGQSGWRVTRYRGIVEVPYWRLFLQFYEEDSANNDGGREDLSPSLRPQQSQSAAAPMRCKECDSTRVKYCAIDNGTCEFYCSTSCMSNFLEESEPPYFDLQSPTMKIRLSYECSINTVNLDRAFWVAKEHMPNLNSVDIYVSQDYIIKHDFNYGDEKKLLLTADALKKFLVETKEKLVSFSFRLGDCCWEEFKNMTDKCRALLPLGTMPNLKKLTLTSVGFDDCVTLNSCLSPGLQVLRLDYLAMGWERQWSTVQIASFVAKLSQLKSLVSLSLADIPVNDHHLESLLPNFPALKSLGIDGTFGSSSRDSHVTDRGLISVARNCPKITSLDANYQRKVTMNGVRALLQRCPDLIELELSDTNVHSQNLLEIFTTAEKLLFIRFGNYGAGPEQRMAIENAVQATDGRVVVCTPTGGHQVVSLSPSQKRNQDESMAKVQRAEEQNSDPFVIDKWEGIA